MWALVEADGNFAVRFCDEHPAECGHADECEGLDVVEIPRLPDWQHGERVDVVAGEIFYDPNFAPRGSRSAADRFVEAVKQTAGARIDKVAPVWRQLNDMRAVDDPEAAARLARIDEIRAWSNRLEALATKASTARALARLRLVLVRTAASD
jgi:hypothetical protein